MWRAKVARVAKRVVLRNLETKQVTLDISATTIYKDGGNTSGNAQPFLVYPLRYLLQGVSSDDAIGDQVTLKGLNCRFNFRNDASNQTVTMVRVVAGWINPNVTTFGSNWRMGTGGDAVSAFIRNPSDNDSIWKKVLVDRIVPVNSILTGVNNFKIMNIRIPLHNKKYEWSEVTPYAGIHEDFVIMVTASTSTGTSTTTIAGVFDGFVRFWYKDG